MKMIISIIGAMLLVLFATWGKIGVVQEAFVIDREFVFFSILWLMFIIRGVLGLIDDIITGGE